MPRAAFTLLLLLAVCGSAAATDPAATVAVGPDGIAEDGDPYYLRIDVSTPEGLREGDATTDDCAYGDRATTPDEVIGRALGPLLEALEPPIHSLHGVVPGCVATPDGLFCSVTLDTCVYASYSVSDGRYYVDPPLAPPLGGDTGLGITADCEGCPPPGCC